MTPLDRPYAHYVPKPVDAPQLYKRDYPKAHGNAYFCGIGFAVGFFGLALLGLAFWLLNGGW